MNTIEEKIKQLGITEIIKYYSVEKINDYIAGGSSRCPDCGKKYKTFAKHLYVSPFLKERDILNEIFGKKTFYFTQRCKDCGIFKVSYLYGHIKRG